MINLLKQDLIKYREESKKRHSEIKLLSTLLVAALLFLIPISLFFINSVYAQSPEEPNISQQLLGLVASATALIATLGVIVGLINKLFKKFGGDKIANNEMYAKIADVLGTVSSSLEATDKGIKDNMDVVGLAIGSLLNNSDIKEKLGKAEAQEIIDKVQNEIDAWNSDLRKYYDTIDPKLPNDQGDKLDTTAKLAEIKARSIPQ